MTLATVKTLLKEQINRGSSYDSSLGNLLSQALIWLERKHTFKYMERFVGFTIDSSDTNPRAISLPQKIKEVNFFRIVKSDGSFLYLNETDPKLVTGRGTGLPESYWLDGMDYLWLDNTPGEDYTVESSYSAYSSLPSNETDTNYPLDNLSDVLISKAMCIVAAQLRDTKLLQLYKDQLNENYVDAHKADIALREKNAMRNIVYTGKRYG